MDLVEWFKSKGGKISHHLTVNHDERRGYHILANGQSPNELLIQVPSSALVNIKTVPDTGLGSHASLAAYLYKTRNVWTDAIERANLPIFWRDCSGLPLKYQRRVKAQVAQIKAEFEQLGFEDFERYKWAWAAVNSRCLYWDVSRDRADQMTLAPLVDFFNHSTDPEGCVQITEKLGKMSVHAPALVSNTDELCLFYGPHENAFLLVEYGFVPRNNQWDYIDLTPYILDLPVNTPVLEQLGFLGDYSLSMSGPCFRTLVALASISKPQKQVERIVQGLDDPPDGESYLQTIYSALRSEFSVSASPMQLFTLYEGYSQILDHAQVNKH